MCLYITATRKKIVIIVLYFSTMCPDPTFARQPVTAAFVEIKKTSNTDALVVILVAQNLNYFLEDMKLFRELLKA